MKAVSCQLAYANRTSFRSNRSVATSASQELTLTSNQLLAVAGNNSSLFTLREHRRADFTSVFMVTSPCQILSPPNSPSCRLALNVVHSLQWFANATARPPPLSSPDVSDSCCCNFLHQQEVFFRLFTFILSAWFAAAPPLLHVSVAYCNIVFPVQNVMEDAHRRKNKCKVTHSRALIVFYR